MSSRDKTIRYRPGIIGNSITKKVLTLATVRGMARAVWHFPALELTMRGSRPIQIKGTFAGCDLARLCVDDDLARIIA